MFDIRSCFFFRRPSLKLSVSGAGDNLFDFFFACALLKRASCGRETELPLQLPGYGAPTRRFCAPRFPRSRLAEMRFFPPLAMSQIKYMSGPICSTETWLFAWPRYHLGQWSCKICLGSPLRCCKRRYPSDSYPLLLRCLSFILKRGC